MKSLPNIQEQIKILGSELNVMSDMLKSIDDVCFLKNDESKGLENLSKKISEQHLYNTYSGINKYLAEKDEYQKSLYIRMLCVVVQYGGSIENGQEAYLQKLIEDCQLENKLEDFLREALCFDIEEFKAFIEVFKEDILRFYFCIDRLILLFFEQNFDKKCHLFADVVCSLEITVEELEALSKIAHSVVEQNSRLFDEARESMLDLIFYLDCSFYVKNFYEGVLQDENTYHFYSRDLTELTDGDISKYMDSSGGLDFINGNVIIQNKFIHSFCYTGFRSDFTIYTKERFITFRNCNSVQFVNCNVYISNGLSFENCNEVSFENCSLICLDSSIYLKNVNKFKCFGCTIICRNRSDINIYDYFISVEGGACENGPINSNGDTGFFFMNNDFPAIGEYGICIYDNGRRLKDVNIVSDEQVVKMNCLYEYDEKYK